MNDPLAWMDRRGAHDLLWRRIGAALVVVSAIATVVLVAAGVRLISQWIM